MVDTKGSATAGLLNRPQTRLADEVAQVLRNLMMRGELAPGSQLLQTQLAEQLGVSRTPLREAFRLLERDGLVRISNGNKTVEVVELDRESLIDAYQVREVVDGLAARLAARRGLQGEELLRMDSAILRMERAAKSTPDIIEYGEAHAEFHLAVLGASGNSRLSDFESLVRVTAQMQLTRLLRKQLAGGPADQSRDRLKVSNEQHRAIFEAISQGNSRAAERAAIQHIRRTIKLLEKLVVDQNE